MIPQLIAAIRESFSPGQVAKKKLRCLEFESRSQTIRARKGSLDKAGVRLSSHSPYLQATLQRPQCIQSIVQCLVFFDGVITRREKFSCSRYDRLFGMGNSRRDPMPIGFEKSGSVKLAPAFRITGGGK
jgi:hypothetical protein